MESKHRFFIEDTLLSSMFVITGNNEEDFMKKGGGKSTPFYTTNLPLVCVCFYCWYFVL
jgi:hypothetical protein